MDLNTFAESLLTQIKRCADALEVIASTGGSVAPACSATGAQGEQSEKPRKTRKPKTDGTAEANPAGEAPAPSAEATGAQDVDPAASADTGEDLDIEAQEAAVEDIVADDTSTVDLKDFQVFAGAVRDLGKPADAVRQLLPKFKAAKLSEVAPDQRGAFLKAVKAA